MVDPSAYFFLALGFLVIRRGSVGLYFLSTTVGVFAKETSLFLLPVVALSLIEMNKKRQMLLASVPAILAYLLFGFYLRLGVAEDFFRITLMGTAMRQLVSLTHPNRILDLFSSFGLVWFPALFALAKPETPVLLKRCSCLIIVIIAIIILTGVNLGRFLAFPVVIPLSFFASISLSLGTSQNEGCLKADSPCASFC
jgi:hypothetical protein